MMEVEPICQISTMLTLLDGCLLKFVTNMVPVIHLEHVFLYCIAWSLGGLLHEADRFAFDSELRMMSPLVMPLKVARSVSPGGSHSLTSYVQRE